MRKLFVKLLAFSLPKLEADRNIVELETGPKPVGQETLVREMNPFRVIGKNNKGRWPTGYLGGVIKLEALALVKRWVMAFNRFLHPGAVLGQAVAVRDAAGIEVTNLAYHQNADAKQSFVPLQVWTHAPGERFIRQESSGVLKADLIDLNGDGFVDRVSTDLNQNAWKVEFGKGDGFGPVQNWTGVETVTELGNDGSVFCNSIFQFSIFRRINNIKS